MTDEEINKLIRMNERLTLTLGYAMGFVTKTSRTTKEDDEKYRWLIKAIENIVYLDKPLPPMP